MVIDTSAVLAILQDEPEALRFLQLISEADSPCISTVSLLEATFVVESRTGLMGRMLLDNLVRELHLEIVPFDATQLDLARLAFSLYGKGRHSARLNFGDCVSYALAKHRNQMLLFKGSDFSQTDLRLA